MLNETQSQILSELLNHAPANDIAEMIVDLLEGWDTSPENTTATPHERAEAFFITRRLAAFFRAQQENVKKQLQA